MLDSYVANVQKDGGAFLVTFPDVPEAVTGGATLEEALTNAHEALELALLTYAADGTPMPAGSRKAVGGSRYTIPVAAAVAAKIAFVLAFRESAMTRTALAAKLGKAETEVRRMLDPYHQTKLPSIEAGLRALGKRLIISIEEAA
jgi:antitoxin HicB